MNPRLALIRQQRKLLLLRNRSQRLVLAQQFEVWRKPLAIADFALTTVRTLRLHPLVIGAAAAFLLAMPRRRLGVWAGRMLTGWEIFNLLRKAGKKRPPD